MMTIGTEIRVAAVGWEHSAWRADFYPHDLPEDWRLSYYSNEFRAVVIPFAQWHAADKAQLESWRKDIHEDFLFYVEVIDLDNDLEDFTAKAQCLESHLGGIILRPPTLNAALDDLVSVISTLAAIAPVNLVLPGGQVMDALPLNELKKHGVVLAMELKTSVVNGMEIQLDPPWLGDSALAVVRVSDNLSYSPRQWHEIISHCLNNIGSHQDREKRIILVIFEGRTPDIESMRIALTVGDLLTASS